MRRNKTAQVMTTIRKPTPSPKIEAGEITNEDTITREEQGQEDHKKHQPGRLGQKLEEMMTATADSHPIEEQAESRKISRIAIMPIAASQNEAKNNAEETKQMKQIKHANQDQEPMRQKKKKKTLP